MPELPEVETIVRDLNKAVLGRKIEGVWSDFKETARLRSSFAKALVDKKCFGGQVKKPDFKEFKKEIKGKKIKKIWRRGKNIIFELSGNKTLLIHQKMTGHLLFGNWQREKKQWKAKISGPLADDPKNKFLHLIFWLDNNKQLALSDLRKFAKVELWDAKDFKESEEFKSLGPEPLEKNFTFGKFKEQIRYQAKPASVSLSAKLRRGKVKQILMDQTVIAGIGNIYSDEILWKAKIHPFHDISKLKDNELKRIYQAMREILAKAIELGGESFSDYRRLSGEKGYFDKERKVYRREGEPCFRCGTIIKRVKLGGRSAHFCPECQSLTNSISML